MSGLDPLARTLSRRRAHERAVSRGREKHLAASRRAIRTAFDVQLKSALTAIRRGAEIVIDDQPMRKAYGTFVRDVFLSFAHGTLRSIEARKQLTDDVLLSWDEQVATWLDTTAAMRITDMSASTKRMLSALIQQAHAEGMSIPNVVNHVRKTFTEMSVLRATRIARTEIIAASNYGSLEGAIATGLPLKKRWLVAPFDGRSRDSHLDAGLAAQRPGLKETFTVGPKSSAMLYPGDPSGPAEEVINCRCTIIYVEVE